MANFWEADPIMAATETAPASVGTEQFWATDPINEDFPPAGAEPGSREYAAWALRAARAGKKLPMVSEHSDFALSPAQQAYEAALEDYRQVKYPNLSPEQFRAQMVDEHPGLLPGQKNAGVLAPYNASDLASHGALFGLTDEISAGVDAAGPWIANLFGQGPNAGDVWDASLKLEQARRDLGRENLGGWGTAAEVLGGLASGGTAVKGAASIGAQVPGVWQKVKGLTGAGASGAAYGFGSTDGGLEGRLPAAGVGAATSVVAGAAAPYVARGVQQFTHRLGQKAATKSAVVGAPTAATIKAASKAEYKAAENTGAVIGGNALNLLNYDVGQVLAKEGLLFPKTGKLMGGYPKLESAVKTLRQYAGKGSLSIVEAQTLNRTFRKVAGSTDPDEARLGIALVNQLDDFMESLPVTAFSTNGKAGMDAVKFWAQARKDWGRYKRTDTIEKAIYNAKLAKGGFAPGLRAQFVSILKSAKKRRGFSDGELAAMERFAEGGSLQDFLQHVAGGGSLTAGVAGHLMAGPVAGLGMAGGKLAAGKAASRALDRGAKNIAGRVRAAVATPGGLPPLLPFRPSPVIDGFARRVGVSAQNALLEDQRGGLAALLAGGVK
jgi:hypothetical protein